MRPFVTALFCVFVAVLAYNGKDFNKVKASNKKLSGHNIRQNYSPTAIKAVNKQISECLNAGYQFTAMSYFFDRADVALPGFRKYFLEASNREMERAHSLMKYMNTRGGDVILMKVTAPKLADWSDGASALKMALQISRRINQKLISMYKIAEQQKDAHLMHYVKNNFLDQQVTFIKQIGDYMTQLKEITTGQNSGLGLFMFDRYLQD